MLYKQIHLKAERATSGKATKFIELSGSFPYKLTPLSLKILLLDFEDQIPVDTGRKLNVVCTFNLRPVSAGY